MVIGPEDSGVVFDWEPTMTTGPELLGPRGSDARFEEPRSTRRERRREYQDRMDGKARAREELWTEREAGIWTDPAGLNRTRDRPARASHGGGPVSG